MSAAAEVLAELRSRGASIRVDGDLLRIRPADVLDPDLRSRILAAKPQVLELLRAAPPDLQLADCAPSKGSEASVPAQPAPKYATPSSAEERRKLLERFLRDPSVLLATFTAPDVGAFLIVRDRRALEALDQEHAALPVISFEEIVRLAAKTDRDGLRAGLLSLLAARGVYGDAVELLRVTRRQADG